MKELKFANRHGYSDVYPFRIVRVISDKTIEVQAMDSHLSPDWKPEMLPGGFSAHCVNNHDQKWVYEENSAYPVFLIRLKKKTGHFHSKHGDKFILSENPSRFHDYNF